MKLPREAQVGTPKLAYVNPSAYGAEGRAWANAFQSIGQAATDAYKAYDRYEQQESVRLGLDAEDRIEQRMIEFDGEHSGKLEFNNEDIPENIRTNLKLSGEGTSPAFQSYAFWRKSVLDAAIKEEAGSIKHNKVRQKWTATQRATATDAFHKTILQRSKQQTNYMQVSIKESIEQDMVDQNYAGAMRKIAAYPGTEFDRSELQNYVEARRQTDILDTKLYPVEDQSQEEYLEQLAEIHQDLMDNEPGVIGQIPQKRDTYLSKYASKIASVTTNMVNSNKGANRVAIANNTTIINNLDDMQNVSIEEVNASAAAMMNLEHPEKANAVKFAYDTYHATKNILALAPPAAVIGDKQQYLDQTLTPEQGAMNLAIYENAKDAQPMYNTDMMAYMKLYGTVEIEDVRYLTPEDFGASMHKRLNDVAAGLEVFGKTPPPMTNQEARDFDHYLEELNVDQKLEYMRELHKPTGMGQKAVMLWDQMQEYGYGGVNTIAGQWAAEGNSAIATMILDGYEFVKEDKGKRTLFPEETYKELKNLMVADLYGVHVTVEQKSQAEIAVESIAAYYASRGLELTTSKLEEAVALGSGGTVSINGYRLISPKLGMRDSAFEDWIKELSPSNFENTQAEYSPELITEGLNKGSIRLRPTGKRGSWFLQDTGTSYNIKEADGNLAFILTYDKYIRSKSHDEIEAAATGSPEDYYIGQ